MKTILILGILLTGISGQALSMGHPHNMFAARKQLRAKASACVVKPKLTSASANWQHAVQVSKPGFSERVLVALSSIRPARPY
ncbi:hypothetical protein [Spirosoma koreense]